ncbi:hypothetical protein CSB20_08330 [bacterium DOLZORAL124_64_63]|nr:MAG: hypothetical protein CSB20_08330 [bacterium DOLZORAL124_64_63]
MKQSKNRQQVDTLYVLGAGASYGLSYINSQKRKFVRAITPLDKDFLSCLEQSIPDKGWRRQAIELVLKDWFDRTEATKFGLEQAIIKRVSDYEFLAKIHPTRIKRKISNEEYLNNLSHLLTDYLDKCKSNRSGNTSRFVNAVFPPRTTPEDYRNRVITFNYDILIERPLIERGVSRRKIYFDRLGDDRKAGKARRMSECFAHPLILKLHGSTNWRCERTLFDQMIRGDIDQNKTVPIWIDGSKIPKPSDDVSPLIIPPIPNKPITKTSIFRFLWTKAYEYLHEAKKIVIVGYSCPPTDALARTMFTHFKNKKIEEFYVVDPNAEALKNYREMVDPTVGRKAKWRYCSDFSEYISEELGIPAKVATHSG